MVCIPPDSAPPSAVSNARNARRDAEVTRRVTIPFPEGLDGDYGTPCDHSDTARAAPDRRGAIDRAHDAIRAFRDSLARLGPPAAAAAAPPANDPTCPRIAA